jgi:peptidoglycan biosynthesis protein MviN/MurJ (putative lipid II flippase)
VKYIPFASPTREPSTSARSGQSASSQSRAQSAIESTSGSLAAWTLALMPVATAAVVLAIAFAQREMSLEMQLAVAAIAVPVSVVLALLDQYRLRASGFEQATSGYLAIVPMIYLTVRGHRCARERFEGYGPLFLHVAAVLAQLGAATIFRPWILAAIYFKIQMS